MRENPLIFSAMCVIFIAASPFDVKLFDMINKIGYYNLKEKPS
ncbi:MAG: hypothetical protein SRB1_00013 [Desulfobacteraceae bacterium Eth-SRB1]|nr:MAG: hypothetical protein SRB1_00013 [Desulfobacteraceae bacterium Eth-SRB1]